MLPRTHMRPGNRQQVKTAILQRWREWTDMLNDIRFRRRRLPVCATGCRQAFAVQGKIAPRLTVRHLHRTVVRTA